MKKFELFMGCFGNGITVYNKAVEENGDYKQIAHIADCGKIKWYVNPAIYVPEADFLKIKQTAEKHGINWGMWLNSMDPIKQYGFLLDNVPHKDFIYIVKNTKMSLADKIAYLKKAHYEAI